MNIILIILYIIGTFSIIAIVNAIWQYGVRVNFLFPFSNTIFWLCIALLSPGIGFVGFVVGGNFGGSIGALLANNVSRVYYHELVIFGIIVGVFLCTLVIAIFIASIITVTILLMSNIVRSMSRADDT